MNELALFAGGGGGIMGGQLIGWRTRCAVEINAYARRVLLARQRDGSLPRFPIWDDITTFDGKPWRGSIDVVSGGFPCQDISKANHKAEGIKGKRSGLWGEMARVVGEIRPGYIFAENSPMLVTRGLDRVLADLASMGYNVAWGVLGARDLGAPHQRDRIWIVGKLRNPPILQLHERIPPCEEEWEIPAGSVTKSDGMEGEHWWKVDPAERSTEPRLDRVANGVAHRVDRIKTIGNGQVPAVAAFAFTLLSKILEAMD